MIILGKKCDTLNVDVLLFIFLLEFARHEEDNTARITNKSF